MKPNSRTKSFATWTHDMFPTLADLKDELHSASLQKGPHQELCATLDALLAPWLRGGNSWAYIDGPPTLILEAWTGENIRDQSSTY